MPRLGALFFLLLAFVVGCDGSQHIGGTPESKRIATVISLSPSTSELMGQYGEGLALIGRTASCNYPAYLSTAPIVGDVKPDYEKIKEIGPDVILYDASLYNENDVAKIKELGIRVIPMDVHTIDEFIDFLHKAGSQLGKETRFSEYVDKIYAARGSAQTIAGDHRKKVAVLMGGSGEYMIAGLKSFQADLVRASGGDPVGPDVPNFVQANVESLIRLSPDVILSDGHAEQILKDPRLASLSAVKKRNVADINADVLLRAGSRVDTFITRTSQYLSNAN